MKNLFGALSACIFFVVIIFGFSVRPAVASTAILGVTQISPVQTFASADGTFTNGWKWVFNVTVPENETILKMKFSDWANTSYTIPSGGNILFYSAQSSNAFDSSHAIFINNAGLYSGAMNLTASTTLPSTEGRHIQVTVETRVPVGATGGSYSTSYGLQTIDPDIATVALTKTAISSASYINLQVVNTAEQEQKTAAMQIAVNSIKNDSSVMASVTSIDPDYLVEFSKGIISENYTITNASFSQSVADKIASDAKATADKLVADKLFADHLVADPVTEQIAALPLSESLVLGDKTAVELASTTFSLLSSGQKLLVTNYDVLVVDIAKILELQTVYDDALDKESAAETAVVAYEVSPITTLAEVAIAEALKTPAENAVSLVLNIAKSEWFTSRISTRLLVISSAKAVLPQDLRGSYSMRLTKTGSVNSLYVTVTTENLATGSFSGIASPAKGFATCWSLTGNTSGSNATFKLTYTGTGSPYYLDNVGTILNKNISGTSTGTNSFTFTMTKQ